MFIKSIVELIYVAQDAEENGSPVFLEEMKTMRCDEMETFSNNYYTEQQRDMRISRNLVVPTWATYDLTIDGKAYELAFCNYLGKRYKVHSILKYRVSNYSRSSTRQKMVLDIQEVR